MAGRLLEIDALRGLTALAVAFVFHIHHLLGYYRTGPLDGLPLFSWLHDYGFVLVDLFFVVSGFIFAHVYLPNGRLETDARTFAAARFARLYPLHLVTLLAAATVLAVGPSATAEGCCNDAYHFALNLAMLQETGLNEGMSFNTPSWSISVEVLCYVLFYLAPPWHRPGSGILPSSCVRPASLAQCRAMRSLTISRAASVASLREPLPIGFGP